MVRTKHGVHMVQMVRMLRMGAYDTYVLIGTYDTYPTYIPIHIYVAFGGYKTCGANGIYGVYCAQLYVWCVRDMG
jgi:hypothetical protein